VTVEAVGTVVLGGVQFTADPNQLQLAWPQNRQVFTGPGNWTQAQDFGMTVGELVLELASGETGPLDTATVAAIWALARQKGALFSYADSFGSALTVLIMDFQPSHRVAGLWDYTLRLAVRAATAILGVPES
jgi:hypothetical protein